MSANITTFSGNATIGWTITLIVFLLTFAITFLLFKNFRRVIYGSIINGLLLLVYFMSRYVGESAYQGDFEPLKLSSLTFAWIIVAIIIGYFAEKTKFIKSMEERGF